MSMILGVDVGNFSTKTSSLVNFESKCTRVGNSLGGKYFCTLGESEFYIGEGNFDNEYRKVEKKNYINLLYSAIALSVEDRSKEVELVLGLPISQFKNDKEILIDKVKENYCMRGSVNGFKHEYYITDVEVVPEGVATLGAEYEGIIVDLGGRTTDCCLLTNKKVQNPISMAKGTINLYTEFINVINSKYSLDLTIDDTERILKRGLKIKGKEQNTGFAKMVFKEFISDLVSKLKIEYSINTNDITFVGGGSILLKGLIESVLPYASINKDGLFANAKAFKRYGEDIWL